MLDSVLRHLDALVSFDTRNPPRAIGTGGIFDYLRAQLAGFRIEVVDHGDGAVAMLAVRGAPRRVFNVHLDTVPASEGWSADPLRLRIERERAVGLGACDIKGAAAGLIAAAQASHGDAAFLFSSDEEANDARCVAGFLATEHGFREAIIAEPTRGQAVLAHRGIHSVLLRLAGTAAHASSAQALQASAVHRALRWGSGVLDMVDGMADDRFAGLDGLRLNIGRIEGGIKGNVVAPDCEVRFNFRPLPSHDPQDLHRRIAACARPGDILRYQETFRGPSLPSGPDAARQQARAGALASALGLPVGAPVDFWTEASLFAQAGLTAFVYGPGDIAQAHTADEWVALDQLAAYAASIHRILEQGPG